MAKEAFNETSPKNDPQPETTTYAVFLFPGTLFAETQTNKVESRDLEKLKVPPNAYGFYFYDQSSITIGGETLTGPVKNESGVYLQGERLLTLDDLKKRHPAGGSVLDQIARKHIRYIVRADGPYAEYQSVHRDSVVVNQKGEIVFPLPEHKAAQARLDNLVDNELEKAIAKGLPETVAWIGQYLAAAKDAPDLRADKVDNEMMVAQGAEFWRNPGKIPVKGDSTAKGKYIVASMVSALLGENKQDYLFEKLTADYNALFSPAPAAKPRKPAP